MIAAPPSRESLLRAVRNFPAAPMILARVGRMLADMDAPIEDLTALLKCDAALTARILRIANSVMYSSGEPCGSLEEAVLRLGFRETHRLTGFAATAQIVERTLPFYGVTAAQFRENALLCALVMERLAGPAELDQPTAYTAGLLRSIGKIALDRWVGLRPGIEGYDASGGGPLGDWETAHAGMNNGETAEMILSEWLFPAHTIEAIRHHYEPATASRLANLLHVAAGAVERCGHGWPGEHAYWQVTPEQFALAGVDAEQVDEGTRAALEAFGPVRAAVG